jgi:hypothetical protein
MAFYDMSMVAAGFPTLGGSLVFAIGSYHADPEDICDPVVDYYTVRGSTELFLWALCESMCPGNPRRIEDIITEHLVEAAKPGQCGCSHDCCGHRFGAARAYHVDADLYLVEVRTSRNY